jgi:hypothetical protein
MLGPFEVIGSTHQGATSGPIEAISSMSQERRWAHSRQSAVSLRHNAGPIQNHRQYVSGATLGPFEAISSMSRERCWAHLKPLAVCLESDVGPIVMFRLGLVVLRECSIQTTIGTVFVHISYFPPTLVASLLSYVMSCVVLCSSASFHVLLILVSLY